MIYAFNFTCDRDTDLSNLMVSTLYKHCPDVKELAVINTDHHPGFKEYGNGAGWQASMLKLDRLRQFEPGDNDFVLSVDSDVVFTSPDVFKYVSQDAWKEGNGPGIIGIKHHPEFNTKLGKWSHMSGALIFIRGDIAKKMGALSVDELNYIRFQCFKPFDITENEDVVLSYLASYVGARQFNIGSLGLSSGDFESDVTNNYRVGLLSVGQPFGPKHPEFKSFYHLNYCPTQFLGEPVTGKWDIPNVLKMKRVEL